MSRFRLKPERVESAVRTLQKRLGNTRQRVNAEAAAQMKSGQYDKAKTLMDIGSLLSDFIKRGDAFAEAWGEFQNDVTSRLRDLGIATTSAGQSKLTAPRNFCIPALKSVIALGGNAEMSEVIGNLASGMSLTLTEADLAIVDHRDVPRWHMTVEKAYRQSQRKGWIEKSGDGIWKITPQGRAVAES